MSGPKIDIQKFHDELNRPLILDGAMGSLLTLDEKNYDRALWASLVNLEAPESVLEAHMRYIDAGAEIITTNTFRTNPAALERSSQQISCESFVQKSVELAIRAREDKTVVIAGSNAPAEDCYQIERNINRNKLDFNHKKHIELLWESGSDFILNETQSHLDEIEIISKFCSSNNIHFIMSFFFTPDLNLLSGEPLKDVVELVKGYSPVGIGFNCIDLNPFEKFLDEYNPDFNWGFYLNCGSGTYTDTLITCGIDADAYLEEVKKIVHRDPMFVGSCCGSTPNHILKIKEYFDEKY
ncbi:homocysteine S-methyltransferase family protein [Bacteroidota bacterium]